MANVVDNGPAPTVVNIEQATEENENYRTTLWTGNNLQVTLMSIDPGKDIGLEVHNENDQFLRIEQGRAEVSMGPSADQMQTWTAESDDAVIVPSGTWHNLVSVGEEPLRLYSIYAPAHHPHGTVHATREEAEAAEAAEHGE